MIVRKRLFKYVNMLMLSGVFLAKIHAATITLTVSADTDQCTLYPGGQTDFSGALSGDLRYCINYILNEQVLGVLNDYQILFAPGILSIQLNDKLSMVNLFSNEPIVIGNPDPALPVTILGGAGTAGLFIRQGNITIQNLNFENCNAKGGNGGNGAGGGMGAGGALFIDTATVTLHNVNFTSCSATAGLGGVLTIGNGGGGGLGGNGGISGGGGGGYRGHGGVYLGAGGGGGGGGAGGDGGNGLGGGGGPILGTNGGSSGVVPIEAPTISPYTFLGVPTTPYVVGGGGYGSINNGRGGTGAGEFAGTNTGGQGGFDGTEFDGGNGGNGGAPQMGSSGLGGASSMFSSGDPGENGLLGGEGAIGGYYTFFNMGIACGGGGGGGYSGGGGGGGAGFMAGGGGGGGGGIGGGGAGGYDGGAGGMAALGGGNGGTSTASLGGGGGGAGIGGGGGGGGFGLSLLHSGGGNGSVGGGGGGGGGSFSGSGGYGAGGGYSDSGGFGGGGGGDFGGDRGNGGFGGGGGDRGTGGFGGGGGRMGISGVGATPSTNTRGGDGAALGGAVFLGSTNAQPTLTLTGNCSTLLNSTSNNSGGGFAGGNDFFLYSGTTLRLIANLNETISLSQSIADDSVQSIPNLSTWRPGTGVGANILIPGSGTVELGGINRYSGTTTVTSGVLNLLNATLYAGGARVSSQVSISAGAVLKGTGTINAPTLVAGTLSPGNLLGNIQFNAPLDLSGTLVSYIEPTSGVNSQIISTSTVDVTGAVIQINPAPGVYPGGAQYTLLTSTGLTGIPTLVLPAPLEGTLSYPNNSIVLTLAGDIPNPPPPSSFNGEVVKNCFLTKTNITNLLTWSPPADASDVAFYEISRNGVVIAVLPASSPRKYCDRNRKKNQTYTYTIVSINGNGDRSTALTVILKD